MATEQPYSAAFYEAIAEGCRSSAEVVVPYFLGRHPAETVIDVGCGQGWWGAEFAKYGCDVIGLDGGHVTECAIPKFLEHDLLERLPELGRFDLVVCLEVAEHLPLGRAASFIVDLCALAPLVLFSAATPHQTGAGHVNCQWQSWWGALFAELGYGVDGGLRWPIWTDERVEPWYRQNLLIASYGDVLELEPLDVIHPVIHEWGR